MELIENLKDDCWVSQNCLNLLINMETAVNEVLSPVHAWVG